MIASLATLLALLLCFDCEESPRQDEVTARGSEVIPFDLDNSTHALALKPFRTPH